MSNTPRFKHLNREEQIKIGEKMLALKERDGLTNVQLKSRFGLGSSSTVSNWIKLALEERGKKT